MNSISMQERVEEEILNSYESLYRLAFSYVHNEQDALDIVQDSVYKAIKSASNIKEVSFIKTWLWRIVINTSMDHIRKKKKEVAVDVIFEEGKEDTYQDFDTIQALEILDEKERAIIILRYFEERKLEEIADVLTLNLNTVKSLLYRSLKKLRVEMSGGN